MPLKIKGKFYRVVVRPIFMYEAKCWHINKVQVQKIMVVEMRTIRWLCGHIMKGKIKNDVISSNVGVTPIETR